MPTTRRLKGRTIAALAADGFEKVELIIPLRALQATGGDRCLRGDIAGAGDVSTPP
jgi:putative intracellular protease/amidase